MIAFRSTFHLPNNPQAIRYEERLLALGSCFVEHIGGRLADLGYSLRSNPFGLTYNPSSLAQGLLALCEDWPWGMEQLVEQEGYWHSLAHHGSFSASTAEGCLEGIRASFAQARAHLLQTDVLILTLGTAWVYRHREWDMVVNNCHRLPSSAFERYRLEVEEVVAVLTQALDAFWQLRPGARCLISLSPVRHLKDGAVENQLSKATLLVAIHRLVAHYGTKLHYFPAYELLLDDLRDYRFYAEDLVHPNNLAVQYIWQHFEQSQLAAEEGPLRRLWQQFRQAQQHRPLHPESPAYRQFVLQQLQKIEQVQRQYPQADFEEFKQHFAQQLPQSE